MSTYGATPSYTESYENLDDLLQSIPDNNAEAIHASHLRNTAYTLWEKIDDDIAAIPSGAQGTNGRQGFQGLQGLRGNQGFMGFQGNMGLQGTIGNDGANSTRWVYGNPSNALEFSSNHTTWVDSTFTFNGTGPVSGTNAWFTTLKNWIDDGNTATLQFNELNTYKAAIFQIDTIDYTSNNWVIVATIIYTPSVNTIVTGNTYSVSWSINGMTGNQGAVGFQGFQGNGVQGAQGSRGFQGLVGIQGAAGSIGNQGAAGPQGIGVQGPNGRQGFQGFQGKINDNYVVSLLSQYSGNQRVGTYNPQTAKFNWVALEGQTSASDGYPSNSGGVYTITLYLNNLLAYTDSFTPSDYPDYSFDGTSYGAYPDVGCYLKVEGGGAIPPTILATTYKGTTGMQGFQGTQGINGRQGTQGVQGLQGAFGVTGPQGIDGLTGTQGVQGAIGVQGQQGPNGTGAQGFQGPQGSGFQGVQGPIGFQGSLGLQGSQGTGAQGRQGIQGSVGPQGTGGSTNIYNSNGFLNGNRQLDGSFFILQFINLDIFNIKSNELRITNAASSKAASIKSDYLTQQRIQQLQDISGQIEVLPDGNASLSSTTANINVTPYLIATNKFGNISVENTTGGNLDVSVKVVYSTPYPNGAVCVITPWDDNESGVDIFIESSNSIGFSATIKKVPANTTVRISYIVNGF